MKHAFAVRRSQAIGEQMEPPRELLPAIRRFCEQYQAYGDKVSHLTGQPHRKILTYIHDLTEFDKRESALLALSKRRENFPELAPLLWGTPGVIAALFYSKMS